MNDAKPWTKDELADIQKRHKDRGRRSVVTGRWLATLLRRDMLLVKCLINGWHVQDDGDCGYEIVSGVATEPTEAEMRELREIIYALSAERESVND